MAVSRFGQPEKYGLRLRPDGRDERLRPDVGVLHLYERRSTARCGPPKCR
jgi:hypothetical protein